MRFIEIAAGWVWESSQATSVLIVLAFVVQALLRKPAFALLRQMIWLLVLVRLLLPFSVESRLSLFNLLPESESPQAFETQRHERDVRELPPREIASPSAIPLDAPPLRWLPIAWFAGACAFFLRAVFQHASLAVRLRRTVSVTSGAMFEALLAARTVAGVRTGSLYITPLVSTPALFGFFAPKILLPPRLQGADANTLRLIFLHELAHVRRLDVLVNWAAIAARSAHWFNPLVWLAMRRLSAEQELLCDATVLRRINATEHRTYADTLLALAETAGRAPAPLLPISADFKHMKERIGMITKFKPMTRRALVVVAPITIALAVVTLTNAKERKTEAPKAAAVAKVDAATASNERQTALRKIFGEQESRLAEKTAHLDQLRREYKIIGDPPNSESISTLHMERIRAFWGELAKVDLRINERQQMLESLKNSSPLQLAVANPPDAAFSRLYDEIESTERQLSEAQRTFGDEHPKVKEAQVRLKTLQSQIDQRSSAMRKGVEGLLAADLKNRDKLRQKAEEAEHEYRMMVEQSRPYFQAKRDHEMLQRSRDEMFIRILQETVDAQVGKERHGHAQ